MAIELPDDFKEFLKLCSDHGVEYLIVGGYAVGYYGYLRATADLDVWVAATPENARRCLETLAAFGFTDSRLTAELILKPETLIRLGVPPLRLELLTSVSGLTFTDCFTRREHTEWNGVYVNVIHLDDLKTNKAAAGRARDRDDLEHLP